MQKTSSATEVPQWSSARADAVTLRNVLMATDFSECSERALHLALGIAARYGATLHLFHCIDSTPYNMGAPDAVQSAGETAWRDLQKLVLELRNSGQAGDVELKFRVEAGQLQAILPEIAQDLTIDLIVVGTHGRTGWKKLALGSVAETVVDHASCPVLVVGPYTSRNRLEQFGPESILFASDPSARSRLAESYAFSLARKYKSRLTVADILEEQSGRVLAEVSQLEWLDSDLKDAPIGRVPAKCPPLPGDIGTRSDLILNVADDAKADLIVLTVPPAHRFTNRIVTTNSYRVVCGARCPVLTVRVGVD